MIKQIRLWFNWTLLTFAPLWAVTLAFVVGAILILISGINPLRAYGAMINGAMGNWSAVGLVLQKSVPLTFAGLGVAFAFRGGLFNIGAEGQIYIGGMVGTIIALYVKGLPPLVHITLCLFGGFIGGGIWGGLPGYLRAKRGLSEIIMTIMLNYVAFWFVSFLVHGPIKEEAAYYPQTEVIPVTTKLAIFWTTGRLHIGFLIAIVIAFIIYFVLFRTTLGIQLRAVGHSISAAKHAGISTIPIMTLTMIISGGLAGLAGIVEILGVQGRLSDYFSPGYGYDAIAVALLGNSNPFGVILAAVFFGALRAGSNMMQRSVQVPAAVAGFIRGATVIFVVIAGAIRMRQSRPK